MKKWMTFFLVAVLLTGMYVPGAVALKKDIIFDDETLKNQLGDAYSIQDVWYENNQLYILLQDAVYLYNLLTGDTTKLLTFFPDFKEKGEDMWFNSYEEAKQILGQGADDLIHSLFFWKGYLYGLNKLTGRAIAIMPQTGELAKEHNIDFVLDEKAGEPSLFSCDIQGILGDKLFFKCENHTQGFESSAIESVNLVSGEKEEYDILNVQRLLPYDEKSFLAVAFDDANAYNTKTGQMNTPQITVFYPETGKTIPLFNLTYYEVGGIASGPEKEIVYYSAQGKIYEISAHKPEQVVGYGANHFVDMQQKAWITKEGKYILWRGWGEGILITALDENASKEPVLSIYADGESQINKAFNQKYPQVPVTTISWEMEKYMTAEELVKAINSQSTQADIFFISPDRVDIGTLINQGVILPLNQSDALVSSTQRLYPYIRQVVQPGNIGNIYGVPASVELFTRLSYFPKSWEALDLGQEEVPKTYLEFIAFAQRWDQLQQTYPDYHFLAGQVFTKGQLLWALLEEYENHYLKEKLPLTYNTTLFKTLMEGAKNLNIPYGEDDVDYLEALEYENSLFEYFGPNFLLNESDSWPMVLSLDEGIEPTQKIFSQIAVVNGNSPNKEMALAYLEGMLEGYTPQQEAALYTDKDKPVVNDGYDNQMASFERVVEEYKNTLESAAEEDKQLIEKIIRYYEQELADKEKYYWLISPQRLDYYKEILPFLYLALDTGPLYGQQGGEVYYLIEDYMHDHLTINQFINELERLIE